MRIIFLCGMLIFAAACSTTPSNQGGGFQVNPFLWRASLEVISFMPLLQANPTGGTITTEWVAERPNERFKLTVYILDSTLRADGLRVSVFRQTQSGGRWRQAQPNATMAVAIENLILTRARALRLGYETGK